MAVMKNIAPFIDLGWYTVPLKGELKRLEDGSKTIPIFPESWRSKFSEEQNTVAAKLGGTITGEKSGILAIDCDNELTYRMFKSLDPDYEFIFKSKGKGKDCGSFIYKYDPELSDNFNVRDGIINLDFYSNNGFVYLPTEANETKFVWHGRMPQLKEVPDVVKVLLDKLRKANQKVRVEHAVNRNIMTANCLAPLVKKFVDERKFMPGLFRIITPKDFRTEAQYVTAGYLHPEQVPEGRGSEYMSKVSAILGADISIDEELYCAAMHDINSLWPIPLDSDRLERTIIDPMITGKASIDGVSIWQYDPNWIRHRLIIGTKRQSSMELGFDDRRNLYYCVDAANEHYQVFTRDSELISYINSVATEQVNKKDVKLSLPIINVSSMPSKPFGFFADSDPMARTLNLFIRTPELSIMEDPAVYKQMYSKPIHTLKFLESLVPEEKMRAYLLRFLKRKLTTFQYSPAVLFFLGVPGSGKDTFVAIIEKIMGKVARPTTREFLEMFNGWLLDTYFVQLDEYGNQLTSISEREEALGKLKAYTGKSQVQIRQMRTDGFWYEHNATFICSANKNPFGIEDGDRRIALFNTPNVLAENKFVEDIADFRTKLLDETCDFCYYLATEVDDISSIEYQKPPESAFKNEVIADSMYASQRLAYVMKNKMWDYLRTLASDYNCHAVVDATKRGRLKAKDLEELYDAMTDFKGEMRSLNKAIRAAGIEIKATTNGGQKSFYYNLDFGIPNDNPFTADEEEQTDADNDD
jgi:hypothetical protein